MIRYCDDCANHICVLLGRCEKRAAIATEAHRAETTSGSVHEGAGAKHIAQQHPRGNEP
jgi:hypothetical protein